ncbi:histidine kinase-like ATPase [Radiomyces spectabilis]|uniref:histidine kinase-like ATPase n=1 Tax=Radiomyces spectabilis TaxID=64574 RepID=UPI00221E6A77|nr:histidine kinase-like ATPase [Radiomyces spectabilis]KAI8393440.1 histidine kinase-like ATPase [Radiomyces spectabilis]
MSHHARHIHALDKSTIRSLHSGQVIVDLVAIVKELVENALDARATAIDVKLVDRGLNSIQVKDNGHGIPEQDCLYMAKPHCTSKIASFQDIDCVTSYGFRGEALSAICAVANHVQITTRTANDSIAKQYDVDTKGSIVNAKPVNLMAGSGTLVVVESPFYNIPVRRQVAQKTALSTLKNIQDVLVKYALAHPAVRFTLMQAQSTAGTKKNTQWIKPITTDILSGIGIVFSPALADLLQSHDITESFEQMPDQSEPSIHLQCILPKIDADPTSIYRGDRVFIYVNGRPINYLKSELKDLVVMFRKRYRDVTGAVDVPVKKTPFMYMDIHVPTDEYDVNVEPSKSAIMFHNKQRLLNTFEKLLDDVYGSAMDRFFHARTLDQPPTYVGRLTKSCLG